MGADVICRFCDEPIVLDHGWWVDPSGGDVCGVEGFNHPHIPTVIGNYLVTCFYNDDECFGHVNQAGLCHRHEDEGTGDPDWTRPDASITGARTSSEWGVS